ncbi:uncharacterized protein CDV56_100476 [Aspergillus thermomutatus]|uniref:Acid phosphatase n=1 Tax=Aspergillus thermomutatus TaxID=41047 RepID=A0A397G386_ASPTH|nr:uncharacterized protein CDV56_100476 [Aspergillus thermomutatus]RHZ43796.1 hypothetical protein CDV56_100476 [Aspergillus thermomutatus]
MKFAASILLAGLTATASALPTTAKSAPSGKWFDRFVVVVLENTNKATALGNEYYQSLTNMGMLLDGYKGTTHPSQPNYISMITSTIAGGVFDDADHNTTQMSLVDLFEPAGLTWKAYMEGYQPLAGGECNPISKNKTSGYVRKHNPFMSFDNIRNSTARCRNIVNAEEHFSKDVALGAHAPNYMFYVPNLANDAHDTNISYTTTDVQSILNPMLTNKEFMKDTLILVTFDENDIYSPQFYGTDNDVYSVLLGNDSLACYNCIDQQFYNHFSQLTTLEQNWNLTNIPNPDGDGAMWDSWMLPFGKLQSKKERGH